MAAREALSSAGDAEGLPLVVLLTVSWRRRACIPGEGRYERPKGLLPGHSPVPTHRCLGSRAAQPLAAPVESQLRQQRRSPGPRWGPCPRGLRAQVLAQLLPHTLLSAGGTGWNPTGTCRRGTRAPGPQEG